MSIDKAPERKAKKISKGMQSDGSKNLTSNIFIFNFTESVEKVASFYFALFNQQKE